MLEIKKIDPDVLFDADGFAELEAEYRQEVGIPEMEGKLVPREHYWQLYEYGLQMLGAFKGDRLIGILFFGYTFPAHYSKMVAVVESYFVVASARKTGAGLRLLDRAKSIASSTATAFVVTAPVGEALDRVMKSAGYRHLSNDYIIKLEK